MNAFALVLMLSLTHGNIPSLTAQHHARLVHHRYYHRRYRRIVFHSPLKGSHASLLRQNLRANEDDLERIQDDSQLEQLTQNGELVSLPESRYATVDPKLPTERRYCRPWTRDFVNDFAQKFYAEFHHPLQVNSAVRTVEFQEQLRRRNGNAAPDQGDTASPHLTGAAVDIAKHGMAWKEIKWSRDYLLGMQSLGLADVEEEFRQSVFHITVYRDFAAYMQPETASATVKSAVAAPVHSAE